MRFISQLRTQDSGLSFSIILHTTLLLLYRVTDTRRNIYTYLFSQTLVFKFQRICGNISVKHRLIEMKLRSVPWNPRNAQMSHIWCKIHVGIKCGWMFTKYWNMLSIQFEGSFRKSNYKAASFINLGQKGGKIIRKTLLLKHLFLINFKYILIK